MGITKRFYIKEVYGCSQCPAYKFWPDANVLSKSMHQCTKTGKIIQLDGVKYITELMEFPDFCPLNDFINEPK